jgi:hypothetical protein
MLEIKVIDNLLDVWNRIGKGEVTGESSLENEVEIATIAVVIRIASDFDQAGKCSEMIDRSVLLQCHLLIFFGGFI